MPTFDDCAQRAGGSLSRDLLDAVRNEPDPTRALQQRQADLALAKRQRGLQAVALHNAVQQMQRHPNGIDAGLAAVLSRDLWDAGTGLNIDFKQRAIMAQSFAEFSDGLSKLRTKAAGFRQDKEAARNMLRAIMGESVENGDVVAIAKSWEAIAEKLRQRFNAAGGNIGKLQDGYFPQYHDPLKVYKYGEGAPEMKRAAWKDFIRPLLDREKMQNSDGASLSDIELEQAMDKAYSSITTNGVADMAPGVQGGKKLANQRAEHRFFVFKDADSWLKYADEFGHDDIYQTLTEHIMGMSHDIALLETLGPNPTAGFRYLHDLVKKQFAPGGALEQKKFKGSRESYLSSLYDVVSGKSNTPVNMKLADISNSIRHTMVSAKLGGAFLSAMSDLAFNAMTRAYNGLPVTRALKQGLSQMSPGNEAGRKFGVFMGMGADAWLNHTGANRFSDVWGSNMAARISDKVMRLSLLSSWTDGHRKAFGLEMAHNWANQRNLSWRDFERTRPLRSFRRAMKSAGITPDEWDTFRNMTPVEFNGVEFLRPLDIIDKADELGLSTRAANDLAAKYLYLLHREMDFAVPSPDARARTVTTMGTQAGTWPGEIVRHGFQFKTFPVSVIMTHVMRSFLQPGIANKAGYFAAMGIASTVMGALALQAKEMSRGKDPRPMDDAKFWSAAMMQGGGAGIFGDYLFSEESRFGQGILTTSLGPTAGLIDDAGSLTLDNLKGAVMSDKDVNFASDAVGFTGRYLPGSSLWYTRLAFERIIIDQLQEAADPQRARKSWRRIMRKRAKDYGQKYWWEPGQLAPERGPDFANAGGE